MKINAVLRCKESEIKPSAYEVSAVITLSDAEYRSVLKEQLKDRGYLKGRTGQDACVLLLSKTGNDGILVDTQGYDYPRYSAFIPNARQIVENFVQRETETVKVESGGSGIQRENNENG